MGDLGHQTWLGDLVRAVAGLRGEGLVPDVAEIRRMLGIADMAASRQAAEPPLMVSEQLGEPPERVDLVDDGPAEDGGFADGETRHVAANAPADSPADQLVRPTTSHAELMPAYNEGRQVPWRDHDPLPQADVVKSRQPIPFTPLLRPGATRGIIQSALSTLQREGEIDVDAAVRELACARPVPELPRCSRPTLRFGVQVMLDRSTGMHPFLSDQDDLVERIRNVAGAHATTEWFFEASPQMGRSGSGEFHYRAPATGRVLVVSGFGIVAGTRWFSDRDEWVVLADLWHRRGIQPVALVPFPVSRVPRWLRSMMPVITWDRTTTVGTVRAALLAGTR